MSVSHDGITRQICNQHVFRFHIRVNSQGGTLVHLEKTDFVFAVSKKACAVNQRGCDSRIDVGTHLVVQYAFSVHRKHIKQHIGNRCFSVCSRNCNDFLRLVRIFKKVRTKLQCKHAGKVCPVMFCYFECNDGQLSGPKRKIESEFSHSSTVLSYQYLNSGIILWIVGIIPIPPGVCPGSCQKSCAQ